MRSRLAQVRPRRRDDVAFAVVAAAVALWAVFQNFFRLGTPVVRADEMTYQVAAWRAVHHVLPALTVAQGKAGVTNIDVFEHPPLGKLLYGWAQLVVGRQSLTTDRAVAAAAAFATGLLVTWWIARNVGRWTGLLAGAFVTVLPETVGGASTRFTRFGFLDPIAALFMTASVVGTWEWYRARGRRAWWWAVATGVAIGCAGATKENAFLGAVGPVGVMLVATAVRDRRALFARVAQVAAAVAVSLAVFLATYLPFSDPITRIRYLFAFQTHHAKVGHSVGYAGKVTGHPDWWANFWFAGHGMGAVLTTFVVVAALAAVVLRRDMLTGWCLAALAAPVVFHCFIADVVLSFYWTLWLPPALVLAALGVEAVVRAVRRSPLPRWVPALVALAVLVVPAGSAAAESRRVATARPEGAAALAGVRHAHGLHGAVLSTGVYAFQLFHYLPPTVFRLAPNQPLDGVDTVIVGATQCRNLSDNRGVRAIVAANLGAGNLRRIHHDPQATIYEVVHPLIEPTPAQLAATPPTDLTAGC